jgi:hypothetical protein
MQVPPFSAEAARSTVEKAFGKPVEELFEEFDFTPLAAASLGQVHLAKLNGKKVVVKVQRPGLRELFAVDLKNVRVIAQWLQVRSSWLLHKEKDCKCASAHVCSTTILTLPGCCQLHHMHHARTLMMCFFLHLGGAARLKLECVDSGRIRSTEWSSQVLFVIRPMSTAWLLLHTVHLSDSKEPLMRVHA